MPGPGLGGLWLLIAVIDRLKKLNLLVLVVRGGFESGLGWKRWFGKVWEAQGELWKNKEDAQPPPALPILT